MNKKKVSYDELVFNQSLPSVKEVEDAILGAIILEPNQSNSVISDLTPELFYFPKNRIVCEGILDCVKNNSNIDVITILDAIKKSNKVEAIGGIVYLMELCNKVSSSANIDFHLKILQENALKRAIIKYGGEAIKKTFDNSNDIFDIYDELQKNLDSNINGLLKYDIKTIKEVHNKIIEDSIRISSSGINSGVPSGLNLLDNVTNGWQKSDLIILAGRPSMGKTAAAVSMIMNPSMQFNIPIGIFSLEMSSEQLVSRMQSIVSGVNVGKIIKKKLTRIDIDELKNSGAKLENAPIYIDDTANISLIEFKSKARKIVKENGVQLIIIDYLQLMRSGMYIGNREQEIAEISRGLKGLAKELDIPIIALSQLSRTVESRNDKKPMLSDLRESGQIEQDADMVVFCYRPEYYSIKEYEVGNETFDTHGLFMFIIAKHRNGELGEIPLTFIHERTMVTNHTSYMANNTPFNQQPQIDLSNNLYSQQSPSNDDENLPF